MFKKSKARANIRRQASSSDDESQPVVKTEPPPVRQPPAAVEPAVKSSLVSFDHQEEGAFR